jgi:beta-galactosidase
MQAARIFDRLGGPQADRVIWGRMSKISQFLIVLFLSSASFQDRLSCEGEASPRERRNMNAGWLFQRQSHGAGELGSFDRRNGLAAQVEPVFAKAPTPEYDDSWWQPVDLPHTWNAHDVADGISGYWRGIGWYRKHFSIDEKYSGKRIFLEFEGVNQVSQFWLNGRLLGDHKGGYTGFEFDITGLVQFGEGGNILTVKVDNLHHPTIPPTVKTDYSFYGGIYRDVWLRICNGAYISAVHWTTPQVTSDYADLRLETRIFDRTGEIKHLRAVHEVLDPSNRLAQKISSEVILQPEENKLIETKEVRIAPVSLWSPETPNLYRIRTTLWEGERMLDSTEDPLGIRWFRFDPQRGFFLNGSRVQIQGTNWHQSYPGMGNALPNSRHVKDLENVRDMGANFWRTSHYPHDVATMEASDRLGLMVWEELPVNKEIGDPDEYIANVSVMAREMIERDRNHPSVVVWGIAGEVNASEEISHRVVAAVSRLYRELDPTRPIGMHEPRGEGIEKLVDVVGLGAGPETDRKHEEHPHRSFMTAEYSASLTGRGIYGASPESEDTACNKHEEHLSRLNLRPWMAGGVIWHQFDYDGETYDAVVPHLVAFGVADAWRIPKEAYYFYESQWSRRPMVHIVGHWTWPHGNGKTREVRVYSNCGEVELFLNGCSLGKKAKGEYPGLLNPPRIWKVLYEPGLLKAVASAEGQEIAHEIRTAGEAHHIQLESDATELTSGDPESLAYITASVVDAAGVVVPDSYHTITFTSFGPGILLPQTWPGHGTGLTWNAVAGKTRVAFRSTPRCGRAVVSAYSPGLGMGRLEIVVTAPGKIDEMDYQDKYRADEIK